MAKSSDNILYEWLGKLNVHPFFFVNSYQLPENYILSSMNGLVKYIIF